MEADSGLTRFILRVSGRSVLMAAVTIALVSCSDEARKVRFLQRADRYFDSGDYEKAKIEYLNALHVSGNDTTALRQIGVIWLEEGAPLRAYPFFARAKELEPTNIAVRAKLAVTFAAFGENDRASNEAISVLEESPGQEEALSVLTNVAESEEHFAEIEGQIRKIPERNEASYHLALAELGIKQGQLAYASSEAEQAIQLNPKSSQAHLAMATLQWLRQNLAEAAQEFQTAAELSPPRSEARLKYARFEVETGQSDKARVILNEMTRKTPDYLPAWCALAQIALSSRRYDEVHSLLENVVVRDAGNVEAGIIQSQTWLQQGETKKAIGGLENLVNSYPHVPVINYHLAQAYLIDNNVTQAAGALNDALRVRSNYPDAILLLAQTNLQQGKPELVVAPLSALLKNIPGLIPAELLLIEAYRRLGRLDEATDVVREEIRRSPQSADAYARLGALLREQQKITEAENAFEQALGLAPDNILAFEQLAALYVSRKDFAAANELIQRKLAKDPSSAVAYLALGKAYTAQADWGNAMSAFHKAFDLNPTLPGAFDLLISTYLSNNQLPQAATELNLFLAKHPSDIGALRSLAQVYGKLDRVSEARDIYEKILSVSPDSVDVLNNLAYLYTEHFDDRERACELARKAWALRPHDPSVADTLGWALYKNGDYGEALTLLRESAEKLSENRDAQFHFGMASYVMGEVEPARQAFQKVASKSGDFPARNEVQRRLNLLENDGNMSINQVEAITARQPEDVVAWMRLGSLLERQGDFTKAATAYGNAIAVNPELLPAIVKLAELNLGPLQNQNMAFAFAKRAKELAPNNAKVTGILGDVAYQLGNFPWAYSLLTESVRRIPDDPINLKTYAWSAYMLSKVPESRRLMKRVLTLHIDSKLAGEVNSFMAMTELEEKPEYLPAVEQEVQKILSAEPTFVPALLARAKLQTQHGDTKSAISTYSDILRRYPDFALAQKYLAELYRDDSAQIDQAYSLALKARNALPDDGELANILGEISYKQQNYPYAIECFHESARHGPLGGRSLYYLGMAQIQIGDATGGQDTLARALKGGLQEPLATLAKQRLAEQQSK